MRRHGEEAYPVECCGVLIGHIAADGQITVSSSIKCVNTLATASPTRYEIAPQDVFRLQRESRAEGNEIVGFYHSHPDHPAQWSRIDLQEAHWTGCLYVITSVENGLATETRSFRLLGTEDEKRLEEEEVRVE